jgi:hypothetical protein
MLAALVVLAAAPSRAETFLIQTGQDSAPYAFLPALRRGFHTSGWAFTLSDAEGDHSFEYYIKWNLPPELSEPGVEIAYAYAWVYHGFSDEVFGPEYASTIGEMLCHEVLGPWSESTLTWNNRPPIDNWFDRRTGIVDYGLLWCDVTELVEGWIANPGTNQGIALTSALTRTMGFHSFQDGLVSPNFRPSLMVETVPEPAAAAGLCAGAALLAFLDRRRARRRRRCH